MQTTMKESSGENAASRRRCHDDHGQLGSGIRVFNFIEFLHKKEIAITLIR